MSETVPAERFNDLRKLFRVTALVLPFVNNLKARIRGYDLRPLEQENASAKLISLAQHKIRDDKL